MASHLLPSHVHAVSFLARPFLLHAVAPRDAATMSSTQQQPGTPCPPQSSIPALPNGTEGPVGRFWAVAEARAHPKVGRGIVSPSGPLRQLLGLWTVEHDSGTAAAAAPLLAICRWMHSCSTSSSNALSASTTSISAPGPSSLSHPDPTEASGDPAAAAAAAGRRSPCYDPTSSSSGSTARPITLVLCMSRSSGMPLTWSPTGTGRQTGAPSSSPRVAAASPSPRTPVTPKTGRAGSSGSRGPSSSSSSKPAVLADDDSASSSPLKAGGGQRAAASDWVLQLVTGALDLTQGSSRKPPGASSTPSTDTQRALLQRLLSRSIQGLHLLPGGWLGVGGWFEWGEWGRGPFVVFLDFWYSAGSMRERM